MNTMSPGPGENPRLSRRQCLAATTGLIGAVAGCTDALDRFADEVLEEVNLFNETDRRLVGSIAVTGPDGTSRLEDSFTLDAGNTDNGTEDDSNLAAYAEVWTEPGRYDVTIEFDEPVRGESTFTETVAIDDPGEQILVVPVGAAEFDAVVEFRVGESFTDTWPE